MKTMQEKDIIYIYSSKEKWTNLTHMNKRLEETNTHNELTSYANWVKAYGKPQKLKKTNNLKSIENTYLKRQDGGEAWRNRFSVTNGAVMPDLC